MFELTHPGIVLPGLLGGVSLLLALLGLSIVPFSWAGLALLALGLVLLGAEAHVPAHGAFAGVGLLAGSPRDVHPLPRRRRPYGSVSPVPIVLVTASVGLCSSSWSGRSSQHVTRRRFDRHEALLGVPASP